MDYPTQIFFMKKYPMNPDYMGLLMKTIYCLQKVMLLSISADTNQKVKQKILKKLFTILK